MPLRILEPDGAALLKVSAIGDVGLIGGARRRASEDRTALAAVTPALRAADLAFANLEFPVGERSWVRPSRSREYHHDASVTPLLRGAGVSVVSLANNHAMDCGPRGLEATRHACETAGIAAIGAGPDLEAARAPWCGLISGRRVTVLAYGTARGDAAGPGRPGIAPLDEALLLEDLAHWRPRCDVLIVSAHWGSMYVDYPPPHVVALADLIESCGADLILGHHPHVVQGFRRTGRCLTLFSLGDAAFNTRSGELRTSVGAETRRSTAVFTALLGERPGLDVEPLWLDDDGLPVSAAAEQAEAFRARMLALAACEDPGRRYASESMPQLMRYELEAAVQYLRRGRIDRVGRLLATIRPRHARLLWRSLKARISRGGATS